MALILNWPREIAVPARLPCIRVPDAHATAAVQYLQVSLQPTGTHWMEEVNRDDYLGNDVGISSRDEFLQTGERKQGDSP